MRALVLEGGDWEGCPQPVGDKHSAMKRFGSPEEFARFFFFTYSDKVTYSVSSTSFVVGGMLKAG